MTNDLLTQEEVSVLGKSMMPKDLYLDLRKMYEGVESDFSNELAEALEDEDKWAVFQEKHKVEFNPLSHIEGAEIKDSGKVLKFNSPEEQDAWLKEQGLLE